MEKSFDKLTKEEIKKGMRDYICFEFKDCHKPCIFKTNNDEDLCEHVENLKKWIDAWVQADREAMEDDCRDYPENDEWGDEEEQYESKQ